jgi:ATP/maltotriose-dependent transcriptional regulator MalT
VTGRWDEAQQLADEAAGLCAATGYPLQTWLTWHGQAMLAAARGDGDKAQQLASQITRWAEPRGFSTAEAAAHHIGSLVALSQGDFEDAYQHATAISPPGVFALNARLALWVPLDLVEAAIRTRRHAEAAAHVQAIRETGVAAISPRLALLAAGSVAIAAPGESALRLFSEALAIPGADSFPFDFARVQLCYGERLRRARAVTESRTQLSAALAIFERLGARSWESRAAGELRATGQPRGRGTERDDDPLTPQERRIAMLAAAGLSNKEIGERLFLSHRTVGAYLYQIFPKLGVRSRAALRDALASVPPEPPGENS